MRLRVGFVARVKLCHHSAAALLPVVRSVGMAIFVKSRCSEVV